MPEENQTRKFTGASKYVLDDELAKIVSVSMALERAASFSQPASTAHARRP